MNEQLQQILNDAPDVPGYGGGKWAIYSVHCCWWTSNPVEHGLQMRATGYTGIPCCPTCRSPLFQAPLDRFIESAETGHMPQDLPKFILAHNAAPCHPRWEEY